MKTISYYILPLLLLLSLFTACSDKKSDEPQASGVFEATEVVISAQTQGEIMDMPFSEGYQVAVGTELARIDTVSLALERRALESKLAVLSPKHYHIATQVAAIRQQIETAQRERSRFAALVKEKAANQKQVDDLDAQIALLNSQLAAQRQTMEQANQSLTAEAKAIDAQLRQIDDRLRRCHILSPMKGRVLAKYAEKGELCASGTPLYKIADTEEVTLRMYVNAPEVTRLKLGQSATVYADQGEKNRKAYKGRITWIADEAEFTPKTIQTRDERANLVYAVKVAVKNDGLIKIGMYGQCRF